MTEPTGDRDRTVAELRLQTHGRWLLVFGATVEACAIGIALVWHIGSGHEMPIALAIPFNSVGFGALCLGFLEYLHRPSRAAQQHNAAQIEDLRHAVLQLVGLMDEDRKHQFYQGVSWQVRNGTAMTGTDSVRPAHRTGEVVDFRGRRNDPPA